MDLSYEFDDYKAMQAMTMSGPVIKNRIQVLKNPEPELLFLVLKDRPTCGHGLIHSLALVCVVLFILTLVSSSLVGKMVLIAFFEKANGLFGENIFELVGGEYGQLKRAHLLE